MIPLSKFVSSLRRRWLEKTVFTRTKDKFTVAIEELPPLIAPSLTGTAVNTEMEKKSVYLTPDHDQPTGLIFASFIYQMLLLFKSLLPHPLLTLHRYI